MTGYRRVLNAEPVTDRVGNRSYAVVGDDLPIIDQGSPPATGPRWFHVATGIGLFAAGFMVGVLVAVANAHSAPIAAKHVPTPRPRPVCLNGPASIELADELAGWLEARRGILPADDQLKWLLTTAANKLRVDARLLSLSNLACPQP